MPQTPHRLTIARIVVEGYGPEQARAIEAEVRSLLGPLAEAGLGLVGEVRLMVFVTDRVAHHTGVCRRPQGAGHSRDQPAISAPAESGLVVVLAGGPPFEVTALLHPAPWQGDTDQSLAERAYLLLHVLGHVLHIGRGHGEPGDQQLAPARSHRAVLGALAARLIDERAAATMAITLCSRLLSRGHVKGGRWLPMLRSMVIGAVAEHAERLCDFAARDVCAYKLTGTGLDDLPPKAHRLVSTTLTALVHALCIHAAAGTLEALKADLDKVPGFKAYVEPGFDALCQGLASADPRAGAERIRAAAEAILDRLGLRITDEPTFGGLHIDVHWPVVGDDPIDVGTVDGA